MTDWLAELGRLRRAGEQAALGTIVSTAGSTPGKEAMKLLVRADGTFAGTVGGGCLEAEVYEAARQVLDGGPPRVLEFHLNERDYPDSGLLCGGIVRVLVERAEDEAGWLEAALRLRDAGVPVARLTAFGGAPPGLGRIRIIALDGTDLGGLRHPSFDEQLLAAAREAVDRDRPARVAVDAPGHASFEVFVEPLTLPLLLVFGGGHVSAALAKVARLCDFRVVVIDDRPAFASAARHPDAHEVLACEWEAAVARFAPARGARCVVVTRGHQDDGRVLGEMARRGYEPVYLGMIGSRTKQRLVFEKLRAAGVDDRFLARVRTPIGLDIGARSHAEIAVSVAAELVRIRRLGS